MCRAGSRTGAAFRRDSRSAIEQLALAKAGDTQAALDELERAADDPASRPDAVRTLVDLSRQVNDRARLERWVVEAARLDRDAATTPGARELLDR